MSRISVPRMSARQLALLIVPSALAMLALVAIGVLTAWSATDLGKNLRVTSDLVNGDVRTFSQVQRELLRLQLALEQQQPDASQIELARQLAAQRVQQGALDTQESALGSPELLARSKELAERWATELNPRVQALAAAPLSLSAEQRAALGAAVDAFERDYNTMVRDAEGARRLQAAAANERTEAAAQRTEWLMVGLAALLCSLLFLVGGVLYLQLQARREQLKASARLRDAEALLKRHALAVMMTDNQVMLLDGDGSFEWVNDAFLRRTGYRLEQVLGRSPLDLIAGPSTDESVVEQVRRRVLGEWQRLTCELATYTRSGEQYWSVVEFVPIIERDRLAGVVVVQSDITARRDAEAMLVQAKDAAEETAAAKERFLASMTHEIRTPLNAVLGLTELLDGTDLDEEQRSFVRTAHLSGQHLLSLVNDILDYSALEAERMDITPVECDVRAQAGDVIAMLRPDADRSGLDLRLVLDPGLPDRLVLDPVRLRQLLINLVGNGLKYTDHGFVELGLGLVEEDGQELLTLRVQDSGRGIGEDELDTIFLPFVHGAQPGRDAVGGTGLGLAICQGITRRMNGDINVSSVPGVGSLFTVRFPVARPSVPAVPPPQLPRRDLPTVEVLLAEDDPVNRTVAVQMLRRLGIAPDVAENGAQAVRQASEKGYDVILMDVRMPTMDGVEATRLIRERSTHRPWIVALTANAQDGARERYLDQGMDDHVAKPFSLDELERALSRAGGRAAGGAALG